MGSYRPWRDVVIRKLIGPVYMRGSQVNNVSGRAQRGRSALHEGNNQPSIRQEVNIAVTKGDTHAHRPQGEALDGGAAGRPHRYGTGYGTLEIVLIIHPTFRNTLKSGTAKLSKLRSLFIYF